eukprot:Sspe_Gene.81784::Locus_52917_Transcript_1_1_Confidence_1.000_Length_6684::g.81784::m.81784
MNTGGVGPLPVIQRPCSSGGSLGSSRHSFLLTRLHQAQRTYEKEHEKVERRLNCFFDAPVAVDILSRPRTGDSTASCGARSTATAISCSLLPNHSIPDDPANQSKGKGGTKRNRMISAQAVKQLIQSKKVTPSRVLSAEEEAIDKVIPRTATDDNDVAYASKEALRSICVTDPQRDEQRHVDMFNCNLEDLYILGQLLADNPFIESVDLSSSRINTPTACRILVKLVTENDNIVDLTLSPAMPQRWVQHIQSILHRNRARKVRREGLQIIRERREEVLHRRHLFTRLLTALVHQEEVDREGVVAQWQSSIRDIYHMLQDEGKQLRRRLFYEARRRAKREMAVQLIERERSHRVKVVVRWLGIWLAIIEKVEQRLRDDIMYLETRGFAAIGSQQSRHWAEARRRQRGREEREIAEILGLNEEEEAARETVEKRIVDEWEYLKELEGNGVLNVSVQAKRRQDLLNEEKYRRSKIVRDEGDGFSWIVKRRDVADQQIMSSLERERQAYIGEEGSNRELIILEEEILRPILEDLIRSCTGIAMASLMHSQAVMDRNAALKAPPMLAIKIPDGTQPTRYILMQPTALPRKEPAVPEYVAVEPEARLIGALPYGWCNKLFEFEEQEIVELKNRHHEVNRQRKLQDAARDQLDRMKHGAHIQRMMLEARSTFLEEEVLELPFYHDPKVLKECKERVLGGTITFRCTASGDHAHYALGVEHLKALNSDWTLEPPQSILRDRIVETVKYSNVTPPPDGDSASLTLYVPTNCAISDVEEILRGCLYQTTYDLGGPPQERKIYVQTNLYFPALTDDDPYITGNADIPLHLVEVETSSYLSVILCMPYVWIPPEIRTMKFTEGDPVEKSVLFPEIITRDPPWVLRENGEVTILRQGDSMRTPETFDGGHIVIEFRSGYTRDDIIVFKGGNEAFFTESDRTIALTDEPFAEIVEGALCKSGASRPKGLTCERIIMNITSPHATAEAVRRVLQRFRFFNVSQDPVEGARFITISLYDAHGFGATTGVAIHVEATDNPTVLSVPHSHRYYHFPCNPQTIPAHMREHVASQDCCVFEGAAVEDVDTELFSGGHIRITISGGWDEGDVLTMTKEALSPGSLLHIEPMDLDDPMHGLPTFNREDPPCWWDVYYAQKRIAVMGFYNLPSVGSDCEVPLLRLKCFTQAHNNAHPSVEGPQSPLGPYVDGRLSSKWSSLNLDDVLRTKRTGMRSIAETACKALHAKRKNEEWRMSALLLGQAHDRCFGRDIFLQFSLTGEASIAAVQEFLHNVVFRPNAKVCDSMKSIDVEVQIGITAGKLDVDGSRKTLSPDLIDPTTFQAPLRTSVYVRLTPPLITLQSKAAWLRYTEGSGSVRIAPFEAASDVYVEGYEKGGFIKVEVVEGACESDVLSLREEGGVSLKLRELYEATIPLSTLISHTEKSQGEGMGALLGRKGLFSRRASLQRRESFRREGSFRRLDSLRAETTVDGEDDTSTAVISAVHRPSFSTVRAVALGTLAATALARKRRSAVEGLDENKATNREWIMSRIKNNLAGLDEKTVGSSVTEVFCDGKYVGMLFCSKGCLQLNFSAKSGGVSRREIMPLLRGLTYANVSRDPQELVKTLRITLSDGSQVHSQAIVEVHIQPVDDVTEIMLRNERVYYRPCHEDHKLPFCIAPLNDARIEDPDTEFFDGGYLATEFISGMMKGDRFGILSLSQQREQLHAAQQRISRGCYTQGGRWGNNLSGCPGVYSVEAPERYLFDVVDGGRRLVAVDGSFSATISYVASKASKDVLDLKVSFPNQQEPVVTREILSYVMNCITFSSSKERLREGQRTLYLLVSDGVNPIEGKSKVTIDVRLPFLTGDAVDAVRASPGSTVTLAPRLGVHHNETLGNINSGFIQVEVIEGFVDHMAETLVLNLKEGGLQLKDTGIFLKSAYMATLVTSTPSCLRLEFPASSRATVKVVSKILRHVAYRFPLSSKTHPRKVRFSGTYDRNDRLNVVDVLVRFD